MQILRPELHHKEKGHNGHSRREHHAPHHQIGEYVSIRDVLYLRFSGPDGRLAGLDFRQLLFADVPVEGKN